MLFWIFFTIASIVFMFWGTYSKEDKIIFIAYWIFLTIVSTLRFDVGYDYDGYWNCVVPIEDSFFEILFSDYQYNALYFEFSRNEVIPRIFYYIVASIDCRPLLFVIYGILTYYFIFKSIKEHSSYPFLSISLYIALFYLSSLGIIRQALAESIVLYSLKYVKGKRLVPFCLLIVIASLIHKTAFLAIVIYPIYNYVPLLFLISILLSLLIFNKAISIIVEYLGYSIYMLSKTSYEGGSILKIFYLFIFAFVIFLNKNKKNNENSRMLRVIFLGVALPFCGMGHLTTRVSEYFNCFLIILLPNLLDNIFSTKRYLICYIISIAFTWFILSVYWSTFNEIKEPFTPYRCVLFTDTDKMKIPRL